MMMNHMNLLFHMDILGAIRCLTVEVCGSHGRAGNLSKGVCNKTVALRIQSLHAALKVAWPDMLSRHLNSIRGST